MKRELADKLAARRRRLYFFGVPETEFAPA